MDRDLFYGELLEVLESMKLVMMDQTELLKQNLDMLNKMAADKKDKNPMEKLLALTARMKELRELKQEKGKSMEIKTEVELPSSFEKLPEGHKGG